jgi:hypothetical protein
MAYTHRDFKNGKQLREAFKAGEKITAYQPGPFGPTLADGDHVIEGPKYPAPHTYYVGVVVKDGVIVRIKK